MFTRLQKDIRQLAADELLDIIDCVVMKFALSISNKPPDEASVRYDNRLMDGEMGNASTVWPGYQNTKIRL